MSDLVSILAATTSPTKETREQAESALTAFLAQSPDQFALELASAMGNSDPTVALSAAVIFRRKVMEDKTVKLQAATGTQLKTTVLGYVTPDRSSFFLKRLGDLVTSLSLAHGWVNEVPAYISTWATSGSPILKETAMYMLEIATDYTPLMDVLKVNAPALMNFLVESLKDPVFDVKSAAAKAVCTFLSGLDESQVMTYAEAMSYVLNVLATWVQTPDFPVDKVKSTFESLAELTEAVPKIWSQYMDIFATVVFGVMTTPTIDSEVRVCACEAAVTLLTQAPGLIKKNPTFLENLMKAALRVTCDVDEKDDLNAWNADLDHDIVVQNTPFSVGKDLLNKLAIHCGKTALPFFLAAIPEYLKSADWTVQHTGLLAIGMIAEGCHDAYSKNLGEILNMLLPYLASENPRLRWAALTSLGLLCSEFEPTIESTYHASIVPAVLTCMSGSLVKVHIQAVSAMVNYSRGVIAEDEEVDTAACLGQYAPALFTALTTLLEAGLTSACLPLLEEVLNVISLTATALKTDFQGYYDRFMPGLKNLVSLPAKSTQEKAVRANCIRCMGYLVESAYEMGPAYVSDAAAIFAGLSSLRGTLEFEDPAYLAISEVASFFASALKEQFTSYLPTLIPDLLNGAKTPVEMSLLDAESPEAKNMSPAMQSITLEVRGQGTKQFSLNTSAMETKTKSCRILYDMVKSLGKLYSPWLPATLETLTELFGYIYSSDIRKYAFKTAGICACACATADESHMYLRQLLPILTSVIRTNLLIHPVDTKYALKTLQWWFEETPNLSVIGLATANDLAALLAETVKAAFSRKVQREPEIKKLLKQETEGEELEELESEGARDDEIVRKVMEVTGSLLKSFKTQFQPAFAQYFKSLYAELFVKESPSDVELLSAVCIFDDYVEHTGDVMVSEGRSLIWEQFLRCCEHTNPDIRQSAVFGIGLCAQFAPADVWAYHQAQSLKCVQDFLQDPQARSPELTVATDCAVSSLGKIALYQDANLLDAWLSQLPIKAEPEEAQAVHKLFLSALPKLNAHAPKVRTILTELNRLVREEPKAEVLDAASIPELTAALAQFQS